MKYLVTVLLFMSTNLFTQNKKTINDSFQEVSQKIYDKRKDYRASGSYVIAIQNQGIVHKSANGLANLEHQVPVTDKTIFDLASIAKMFTGYSISFLEEQKLLSSNDNIRKYLPNFPDYGDTITIGNLVHHTSGIKNWTSLLLQQNWEFSDRISFDQLIRLIYAQKELDFIPGSQYKYSNSGYNLLVQIIEKVTGENFETWTYNNIFSPLSMNHTFFNATHNRIIPNLAQGYYYRNGKYFKDYNNLTALGSSSLYSNGADMAKWMNFLLNPPDDKKKIIKRMFTTKKLNSGESNKYAYGIEVEEYNGTSFIGHDGSWASNTSYLVLLPEHNSGIFVIHNFRTNTRFIINKYVDIFLPSKQKIVKKETLEYQEDEEIILTNEQLYSYTGTYKLAPAWYMTITKKGNELFAKSNGEDAFPMTPVNDTTFTVAAYGNRAITFSQNESNKGIELIYRGKKSLKRTIPKTSKNNNLRIYEGYYYCKELELLFNFKANANTLSANSIRIGNLKLTNLGNDEFYGVGVLIRVIFDRDSTGKIIGFYVSNSNGKRRWSFIKAER